VVCSDLRGYGDSGRPESGPDHVGYSKRAMAQDQVQVMSALGFDRFAVAGHDRGGRVTRRLCLDHPERVTAAAVLDIVPTAKVFGNRRRNAGKPVVVGKAWTGCGFRYRAKGIVDLVVKRWPAPGRNNRNAIGTHLAKRTAYRMPFPSKALH
jgi:pimeloyl-ACP methyl ester carboxylesterase